MPKQTVLLTGATGFLGSYLLKELLAAGYADVRALRRSGSKMDLLGGVEGEVHWYEGDITDIDFLAEAMQGVEAVFHVAALVSFLPKDKKRLYEVNVKGTAKVVNAALAAGVKDFIHVSSTAALGRSEQGRPITEDTAWDEAPYNTNYAHSKYLAELEVWRGQEEGLQVAVVNPAVIVGAGRPEEGTMRFFSRVKRGMSFYPPGTTGFVDVRDVARFMRLIYEGGRRGERFILSAENLTYKKFFDLIADALGVSPPSRLVTPFLKELAWRLEGLRAKLLFREPFLTRETANTAMSTWLYDNNRSLTVAGFRYTPIRESIAETARHFLKSERKN